MGRVIPTGFWVGSGPYLVGPDLVNTRPNPVIFGSDPIVLVDGIVKQSVYNSVHDFMRSFI